MIVINFVTKSRHNYFFIKRIVLSNAYIILVKYFGFTHIVHTEINNYQMIWPTFRKHVFEHLKI